MPTYVVTAPDGKKYNVTAPDGASQDEVLAYAQKNYGGQQQPQAPQGPTAGSRAMAGLGGLTTGASYLAGIPMDTIRNIGNLGLTGYGALKNLATGRVDSPPVIPGLPGGGESITGAARSVGLPVDNPNPEDPASRMLHTGGTILGGSLMPGGGVKSALAAATGGAIASEIDPRLTILGALAPGGIGAAGRAMKGAMAPKVAANVNTFQKAGLPASVGMATNGTFFHGVENLLAKFPGGTGVLDKFRKNMQETMGAKTRTGVTAEDAGRAIETGITGKKGFLAETLDNWKALDAKVGAKVPKGTVITPLETARTLDELTSPAQGAEKTTASLVTPKLKQMRDDLEADMAKGQIPFEAIRALRTKVGSMREDAIVSNVPQGEIKRLYGALSKDLEQAAMAGGAGKEFLRQQSYYSARMDRIEKVLDRVLGKNKQPEDIYKTFYSPEGVNKIRGVVKSLPPEERKVVARAVMDRLGKAAPGKQNEAGELFSSETFLTNWTRLHDGAKSVLFPDPAMRGNLDSIASAASKIRHSNAFANPSGTAGSFAGYSVYLSPLVSLAQMDPTAVITAATAVGAANISAKLLTNQKFVNWLATGPQKNPKLIAAHFTRLAPIYNSMDDDEKKDLDAYVQSMNGEQ